MKERPILFSGPLVRALLAGTKTQTRRPIKPQPNAGPRAEMVNLGYRSWGLLDGDLSGEWRCPYGVPGERLWVKETWCQKFVDPPGPEGYWAGYWYAATDETPDKVDGDGAIVYRKDGRQASPWISGRFMPRAASRLTLEITDVRVQRLQEISDGAAEAEGVRPFFEVFPNIGRDQRLTTGERAADAEYRASFAVKWDEIYGDGPLWIDNPWVWALTFKVQR